MSALTNLLPLLILAIVLSAAAYIGYQLYTWSNEMSARGKESMEKRNLSFTKDGGLKVGVKELGSEDYEGKTQKVLVNAWNSSGYGDASGSRPGSGVQRPGSGVKRA